MGLFSKDRDLTKPPEQIELKVDASALGLKVEDVLIRLDSFLAMHLKWRSRSSLKTLVKEGWVHVDASTPERPMGTGELTLEKRSGRKLRHGSRVVVVIPPDLRQAPIKDVDTNLTVIYEDDACLVLEKPAPLAVHATSRYLNDNLILRVHAKYSDAIAEGRMAPRLCHRLDRETSGAVLVAKTLPAHAELARQFEEREVEKHYFAIVHGEVAAESGSCDHPIGSSRTSTIRLKMACAADGQESRTDWRVVERALRFTLLECELFTGRQHQIRLHLAALGHSIVGDKLYGDDEMIFQRAADDELTEADHAALLLERHALHHHRLAFTSPSTGERVVAMSPLPTVLRDFFDERAVKR
ncbi:MAG: RluA family pseudouridine synthase [Planctomycetota bacterium]|nr:RluA family pseudouridine synthase [Planctomycetota bacterium]